MVVVRIFTDKFDPFVSVNIVLHADDMDSAHRIGRAIDHALCFAGLDWCRFEYIDQ